MNDDAYSQLLGELKVEADQATWHLGYLKAFVDDGEVISERLNGSDEARVGIATRTAAQTALILYCARSWDSAHNAITLKRAKETLPSLNELVERRRKRLEAMNIVGADMRISERYGAFCQAYEDAKSKSYHSHLRLLRTEHYAHRFLVSRDRLDFERKGIEVIPATFNDLFELSELTMSLTGQLGYLWDQSSNLYPDRIAYTTKCSRVFLRNMPVFKEVESSLDRET